MSDTYIRFENEVDKMTMTNEVYFRLHFSTLINSLNLRYSFPPAPICLPEKNEVFLGKFGWAAGWGALNPGSRLRPKTLQAVDVPVIDNKVCERWHRSNGINVVIYPEMLCAGYRNGESIDRHSILDFSRKLMRDFFFFLLSNFPSNLNVNRSDV